MSTPRVGYQEQIERNRRSERAARRDRRLSMGRTVIELMLAVAVGFGFIAFSAHTRDEELGHTLFRVGQLAWVAGVLFALLAAYRRGERRGDW